MTTAKHNTFLSGMTYNDALTENAMPESVNVPRYAPVEEALNEIRN